MVSSSEVAERGAAWSGRAPTRDQLSKLNVASSILAGRSNSSV